MNQIRTETTVEGGRSKPAVQSSIESAILKAVMNQIRTEMSAECERSDSEAHLGLNLL